MTSQTITTNLQLTLNQLEPFGFKFFGYDENNSPLVIASNGQVIRLDKALSFVKSQLSNINQLGKGPEQMPQMPNIPTNPEGNLERNFEKEQQPERQAQQQQQTSQSQVQVPSKAPKIVEKPQFKPYGEGYEPPFDSNKVEEVLSYIEQNSKKNNVSSAKWLAILWDKFIKELEISNKN